MSMLFRKYYATPSTLLFASSTSQMSTFIMWVDANFTYLSTGLNFIQIDLELVKLYYEYSKMSNSVKLSSNSAGLEKKIGPRPKFRKLL
jgi:hypothetical protein